MPNGPGNSAGAVLVEGVARRTGPGMRLPDRQLALALLFDSAALRHRNRLYHALVLLHWPHESLDHILERVRYGRDYLRRASSLCHASSPLWQGVLHHVLSQSINALLHGADLPFYGVQPSVHRVQSDLDCIQPGKNLWAISHPRQREDWRVSTLES